jgi:hypothetical protein
VQAFRIGGSEDRASRRRLGEPEHGRTLDPELVHDGADVVHPRLDREAARPVGQPDPAWVDDDQPSPARQLVPELGEAVQAPERPDVRQEREEHEIALPLADDLVRDRDVAAPRVPNIGHVHASESPI